MKKLFSLYVVIFKKEKKRSYINFIIKFNFKKKLLLEFVVISFSKEIIRLEINFIYEFNFKKYSLFICSHFF